ncbi:MAG: ABC-type transport auxiliary lipoprotein family protein [Myxococcales bacterium]|nr:ABC-type transport auxiliary lipoprotein family protein [Myxococcales bacterium]
MSSLHVARLPLVALTALLCAGCALTSKSDPVTLRYFTPDAVPAPTRAAVDANGAGRGLELRIGRVNAASNIKDRIAFRDESHEIGYYDDLRWSEKPESYLRRAIARALFEERGVRELVGRAGATLEIELDAFEELRAPRHVARVEITWLVRDEQAVQLQRSFTIERAIAPAASNKRADAIASAMAVALAAAVDGIATEAVAEMLRERTAAPPQ